MFLLYLLDLTPLLLFVLVPYFFVCLYRYLHARKYWKEVPCKETQGEKESLKRKLLVISVILLVVMLILVVLISTSESSVVFA